MLQSALSVYVFLLNDPATTEIYTLSLHDALPIFLRAGRVGEPVDLPRLGDVPVLTEPAGQVAPRRAERQHRAARDRKSTRLNSSHANISYAVFCLKKRNR